MKLSELLTKSIKLKGGSKLNLKGFSKRVIDKELSSSFGINDIINYYTDGKVKTIDELGTIVTDTYHITESAPESDYRMFPYVKLTTYTDGEVSDTSEIIRDIEEIAVEGYFLMKNYIQNSYTCLCKIYTQSNIKYIDFICPINTKIGINTYMVTNDIMKVNNIVEF